MVHVRAIAKFNAWASILQVIEMRREFKKTSSRWWYSLKMGNKEHLLYNLELLKHEIIFWRKEVQVPDVPTARWTGRPVVDTVSACLNHWRPRPFTDSGKAKAKAND